MRKILVGLMCPFCGECFDNPRSEAKHIRLHHDRVKIKIEGVEIQFHSLGNCDESRPGAACFCRTHFFGEEEYLKHLVEAGGMAKHLEAVGWQIMLDRVAGDDYDKPQTTNSLGRSLR